MIPQYQFFFRSFDRDSFAALPVPSDMDEPFDGSEDEEDEGREDVYDENTPLTYFNLKEFRLSVSEVPIHSRMFADSANSKILGMMIVL